MEHARPPPELQIEGSPSARAAAWQKWWKHFSVFMKASGVNKKPKDVQASLLVNLIGPGGYEIYSTFEFETAEKAEDLQIIKDKFDLHFGTKTNITMVRFKFFTRNQNDGETISQYVTALRLLSQGCEFDKLTDGLIRDRVVCGITNNVVRDRLLRADELTLDKAIQICEADEMSKEESKQFEESKVQVDDVVGGHSSRGSARATAGRERRAPRREQAGRGRRPGPRAPCPRCGNGACRDEERCPAVRATCFVCDRWGHFARVCSSKPVGIVHNVSVSELTDSSESDAFYVDVVEEQKRRGEKSNQWIEYMDVKGKRLAFKLDTGSMLNIISKYDFDRLELNCELVPYNKKVYSYTGNTVPIIGACTLALKFKNKYFDITFAVAKMRCQNILGLEGWDEGGIGLRQIVYLGHVFDAEGMKPDQDKVKAIVDMPDPTDRKSLERFLGMVNYLAKFIPNYSESVASLRGLLRKDSEWLWDREHSEAVKILKAKISSAPVLSLYSNELPVVVSVDASSEALGAVLLQGGRPVEFASVTLTDTQRRYAQIEKEMLAIVHACERFNQYIFGRSDVTIQTDHKPLESIFKKPLSSVPARLQRMILRMQGYDVRVQYTPGRLMYIADTLSRAALPELMNERLNKDLEAQTCFLIEHLQFSDDKLSRIRTHVNNDEVCKSLINYIVIGWPKNKYDVDMSCRIFWPYRGDLQYTDGLILKDDRVFIPAALREEMVRRVHEGHLGIERCKRRAREVMFWPGLGEQVEAAVRACAACALHAPPPRRETLRQHAVPDVPWCKLGSDIFEYKKKYYLLLVDYFSNYVEVNEMHNINSKSVITAMTEQFCRHGIPMELVTDNGPAYDSREFKQFMSSWEIKHTTSSPMYAQANGKSERSVRTVKNLLKKCLLSGQDYRVSLLNYRATPRDNIDSPAQILFGRRLNTRLPTYKSLLTEPVDNKNNYAGIELQRQKIKSNYDKTARDLPALSTNTKVVVADGTTRRFMNVVSRAAQPRSYILQDAVGRKYRRNRRHIISRELKQEPREGSDPASPPSAPSAAPAASAGITQRDFKLPISSPPVEREPHITRSRARKHANRHLNIFKN